MSLAIQQLTVRYGRRPVVHDLTLPALQRGTLTALLGPNGAGKSTLLRAMAGLETCSGGLHLDGTDLMALAPGERGQRVTYMPQTLPPNLALSVLECVLAAVRAKDASLRGEAAVQQALAALQQLGIAHLGDTALDSLSGGQRQLVSLAQVVARTPQVMLLDEPTSALDLNYQLKVMECVRAQVVQHQLIAVVVLHDINLAARYADQLVVLEDGKLYACGTPHQVLNPLLFQDVYGVQARVERCSRQMLQVVVDHAL